MMNLRTLLLVVMVVALLGSSTVSAQVDYEGYRFGAAWSPDGSLLALGGTSGILVLDSSLAPITEIPLNDTVWDVTWKPDGTQLAGLKRVDSDKAIIDVWNMTAAAQTTLIRSIEQKGYIEGDLKLAWHPTEDWVAANGTDARVWDVATGNLITRLDYEEEFMGHTTGEVAWSPDGEYLAVSSGYSVNGAQIWDTESWHITVDVGVGNLGRALVWSPDGEQIATDDEWDITLWHVPSGEALMRLEGHTDHVLALSWHDDFLVSSSARGNDGSIRIWDMTTGTEVATINDNAVADALPVNPQTGELVYVNLDGGLSTFPLHELK